MSGRTNHHRATDEPPGRPAFGPEYTRTEAVRVMLRPSQLDDLRTIAAGWDVKLGTAAYAIIATELARARREEPDLGSPGIAIAAGMRVLGKGLASADGEG